MFKDIPGNQRASSLSIKEKKVSNHLVVNIKEKNILPKPAFKKPKTHLNNNEK
jgi:hypothetical protein